MKAHRIYNVIARHGRPRSYAERPYPDRILTWAPTPEEAANMRKLYEDQAKEYQSKFDHKAIEDIYRGSAPAEVAEQLDTFEQSLADTDLVHMLFVHSDITYLVKPTLDDVMARCTCVVPGLSIPLESYPVAADCPYHADDAIEAARRKPVPAEQRQPPEIVRRKRGK